jgi:hypothetical protein
MNLWPIYTETIVLSYDRQTLLVKLDEAVRRVSEGPRMDNPKEDKEKLFNGVLNESGFRISKRIKHAENFLPLISGQIESASGGSILFLTYKCFFSTLMFLGFWSIITLIAGFVFIFPGENFSTGLSLVAFGVGQYILSMFFFYRQVNISRKVLFDILEIEVVNII